LIILITLGEEYKLWCSSLCSFLQPPVTSQIVRSHKIILWMHRAEGTVYVSRSYSFRRKHC
jgi:hypothetical protein